ncbi:MAG: lytic murein transglycosylase [Pseudomonadota bacterium]
MKTSILATLATLATSPLFASGIAVTEGNFAFAETDRYMAEHSANYAVNTIRHSREPSSPDNQFVITENKDVLYSHAVVDTMGGATIFNPDWDYLSMIQIIDENHYTLHVLYSGESVTLTPEDLTTGRYVFLNMRTGLKSTDDSGLAEAHAHQDGFLIEASAEQPYAPKGFEKESLDKIRASLVARASEANKPELFFGRPEEVDPEMFLIATAKGWGGLPYKDAVYISTIVPQGTAAEGACSEMTLPRPPLKYDEGAFFSVTTYSRDSWIVEDNFAFNNRAAEANADGSITFRYNCSGAPNNIDVQPGWTQVIRLYQPQSPEAISEYVTKITSEVSILPR